MKKRIFAVALAFLFLFSSFACGREEVPLFQTVETKETACSSQEEEGPKETVTWEETLQETLEEADDITEE